MIKHFEIKEYVPTVMPATITAAKLTFTTTGEEEEEREG